MIDDLVKLYQKWIDLEDLPIDWSADELIREDYITKEQRAWLNAFITLWDLTQ